MKKFFFCFLILLSSFSFAQRNNFNLIAGTTSYPSFIISGDYSSYTLNLLVNLGSGSYLQVPCSKTYTSPNTTAKCTLYASYTRDLAPGDYNFNLYGFGTDTLVVAAGYMKITKNVFLAGVPATFPRYTLMLLDEPDHDTTFVIGFNDDSTWREINIDDVRSVLGTGGDTTPDSVIFPYETNAWDKVASDDVTLSGTQDISGQKTFSNSKTVFSGDSVGVRGNLDIDGTINIYGGTGDVNDDGGIYAEDYTLIRNYIFQGGTLTELQKRTADINGDNVVDGRDLIIYNYISGYEAPYDLASGYLAAKYNGIRASNSWFGNQSFADFYVNGFLIVDSTVTIGDYTFPNADGSNGQVLKTNGNGNLTWSSDATGSGGAAYTDSVTHDGRRITGDSLMTDAEGNARFTPISFLFSDEYNFIKSDWLDYSSPAILKLGKPNRERFFNNGAYTDFWIIDYVIPPYNLSANWLYPIEHRTDYYNDTLNTVAHSDILQIDGTGTPSWRTNGVNIMGNEIQINVGDLPDSTALNWATAGLAGNKVILGEANKTAGATRFPMPVKGYEFKFGSTPYYTYPRVYGFYSDLTTNIPNLETAYHFYGQGDYPSYFGGDLIVNGEITSGIVLTYPDANTIAFGGDAIQLDPATLEVDAGVLGVISESIIGTSETLDSLIRDYWIGTLGSDTTGLWATINAIVTDQLADGDTIIGTAATLDSLIRAFWNDDLGGWDSTYAYQRITALEDSIASFRNIFNAILTALDTCGCSVVVAGDTIPNNFEFDDVTDAALNSYHTDYIVVAGCDSARFYPASGDTIRVGALGIKRIAPIWVDVGDTVYTFNVASGTNSTTTRSIVYSANGTPVDSFNVTTVAGSYSAATLAYQSRVEADGGEVISLDAVEEAYDSGINMDNCQLWAGAKFGIKKNANNKVTVMYDLSNNDNDLIQTDTSHSPTSFAPDSILFYRNRYMVSTFNSAATQPITIVMASDVLWKNETGTDQIYDGLDGSARHNLQNQGTDRDFFAGTDFISTTSVSGADPSVVTVVTNTTDSMFVDGTYATSGDAGSHNLAGIYLNSANGGGASGTQIPLFEIFIYDGTGVRATAESNINTRWSIY